MKNSDFSQTSSLFDPLTLDVAAADWPTVKLSYLYASTLTLR